MTNSDIHPISDDDRQAAVERLRAAHAAGRMDRSELTTRIQAIQQATTHDQLAGITADLTADLTEHSSAAAAARSTGRGWMVSVFGDVTRSGSWRAHEHITPMSLFGDVELDLRKAAMPPGDVTISAVTPFGNIEVIVPDDVEVDVGGFTLFGSKKIEVRQTPPGSVPVIRVRAFSLFGSVKVWTP